MVQIQRIKNSDKELVTALKNDDISAFNQLFYAYSSRLYHFAYGYLKSKEEAEELVQEVFIKVWDKRKDLQEEYRFKSYLFTIAYNHIKKHFRSKAIQNNYLEFSGATNPEALYTREDVNYPSLKKWVDKLVDKMPDKRRTVFVKSRFEGKNVKEIAEEMGISQSTVENHLNQALKFLKQHLKDQHLAGFVFFCLFIQ